MVPPIREILSLKIISNLQNVRNHSPDTAS